MKAVVFTLALAVLVPAAARAQDGRGRGPAPALPAPHNLQVLPKDTPPQQVVALMQQFTRALGVQCTYCHAEVAPRLLSAEEAAAEANNPPLPADVAGRGRGRGRGRGGPQIDFASDDKRQKQTARVMLRMVDTINARLAAGLHKPDFERVQCQTCHRGVTNPQQLPDLLRQTMLEKGEGAAVARYRELRQAYQGTEAYDFREATLLNLGRESLATKKPDDALAWLQLNVEFYPKSAASYVALAQVHLAKRDREAAVGDLTKALALEPDNAEAKRQLALLRK